MFLHSQHPCPLSFFCPLIPILIVVGDYWERRLPWSLHSLLLDAIESYYSHLLNLVPPFSSSSFYIYCIYCILEIEKVYTGYTDLSISALRSFSLLVCTFSFGSQKCQKDWMRYCMRSFHRPSTVRPRSQPSITCNQRLLYRTSNGLLNKQWPTSILFFVNINRLNTNSNSICIWNSHSPKQNVVLIWFY